MLNWIHFKLTILSIAIGLFCGTAVAQEAPFDKFKVNVEERDKGLESMHVKFYDMVELIDAKTARVTVTNDWMKYVTVADNQGNINSLFDAWRFSHGANATGITLIVVAPDASVIREVSN